MIECAGEEYARKGNREQKRKRAGKGRGRGSFHLQPFKKRGKEIVIECLRERVVPNVCTHLCAFVCVCMHAYMYVCVSY